MVINCLSATSGFLSGTILSSAALYGGYLIGSSTHSSSAEKVAAVALLIIFVAFSGNSAFASGLKLAACIICNITAIFIGRHMARDQEGRNWESSFFSTLTKEEFNAPQALICLASMVIALIAAAAAGFLFGSIPAIAIGGFVAHESCRLGTRFILQKEWA